MGFFAKHIIVIFCQAYQMHDFDSAAWWQCFDQYSQASLSLSFMPAERISGGHLVYAVSHGLTNAFHRLRRLCVLQFLCDPTS